MYPYNLSKNPYPSSPTPTLNDATILGGKRHKEARDAILECINDIKGKSAKDFKLITIIQDVGTGKTHLALHLKATQKDIICSYVDLSTLFPRGLSNLYNAIVQGFGEDYIEEMRTAIINYIKSRALNNEKPAKKFFRQSFFNRNIEKLANEVLNGRRDPDTSYVNQIFNNYEAHEISMIKNILYKEINVSNNLEDILANLAALAKLNMLMLKKVTMIEIDELDADRDATDFTKAVINAHLPYTVMLLITTPSLYSKIRDVNSSLFDRIEKANYKVDLAGSSMFDEIADIVLEYIRVNVKDLTFSSYEADITNKIRVIYDEFKEFRNIRSMLNIMYHTMETAKRKGVNVITEEVIDETINHAYPGLRVKGSIMNVPISEFIKIRREYRDDERLELSVKNAIKSLVMFAHEKGKILPEQLDIENTSDIDAIYVDDKGKRIGVVVTISKDHTKIFERINKLKKEGVDKLIVLTNANTVSQNGNTVISLDKCKMVDLIYFSNKYKQEEIEEPDTDRALVLAKSVLLC
ncbi:MAG: hypothetical protein KatS3mg003_1628 [Candidatus Nitrosocaldaceae archaeon]|nr:MAG: hypothetical protein KatS3mg003_0400 [Candidatus Nitrosocaldaceae archaeon]GIU72149.1 MAG: hypothetical protein KatS3mg003_1628 [Candidatus Nitrosocaldaceae archaeon]